MDLLKLAFEPLLAVIPGIYIPIWIYSNCSAARFQIKAIIFTFQYGSTQMTRWFGDLQSCLLFTFQYGSTQILFRSIQRRIHYQFTFQYGSTQMTETPSCICAVTHLHSNMDLLKFDFLLTCALPFLHLHSNMDLLKSLLLFAFSLVLVHLHSNMDLLKFCSQVMNKKLGKIYIPIWIYSNFYFF